MDASVISYYKILILYRFRIPDQENFLIQYQYDDTQNKGSSMNILDPFESFLIFPMASGFKIFSLMY